jgi:hypothetical protein
MEEEIEKKSLKDKLLLIHFQIEKIFYFLITELVLPVLEVILGVGSWMYPIFNIWTDIIDRELTLLKIIGYIFVGIILFYTSLALYKLREQLKAGNKFQ